MNGLDFLNALDHPLSSDHSGVKYVPERGKMFWWKNTWRSVCKGINNDDELLELHSLRQRIDTALNGLLKVLDGKIELLQVLDDHERTLDEMLGLRRELTEFQSSLFPRWQTQEDLEAMILEQLTPSFEKLRKLAAQHPPPQSWYEEPEIPIPADQGVS